MTTKKATVKIGDVFITNEGYRVEVVDYKHNRDVKIRFEKGHEKRVETVHLKNGRVKNPFHPSVCGIGYCGDGPHKTKIAGKHTRIYKIWTHMIERCYNHKTQEKQPTYIGCSVCDEWHNFQNFAEWCCEQPNHNDCRFHLDKDLFVMGNRTYAPDFCTFVPYQINCLLGDSRSVRGKYPQGVDKNAGKYRARVNCGSGKSKCLGHYGTPEEAYNVYKKAKVEHVREMANKHKEFLHPTVYNNLINWTLDMVISE